MRYFRDNATILTCLVLLLAGCEHRQLASPTIQMDIEDKYWIRILLLDNVTTCTLNMAGPFRVLDGRANSQTQTSGTRFNQAGAPINIQLAGDGITIGGQLFKYNPLIILPDDPYIFTLNGKDYRGKLRLIIHPDGRSFDAINLVPPEPYLAGVVGAEMPDYWEIEALQAQAIAARTYCFYIKKRFGAHRNWDVKQTAAHQVYRGIDAESAQVWQAVNQTKGQVLVCRQADGTEDIFPSYYSSTCGGHTENSENVFGDSYEPLTGIACPFCQHVAKPRYFFWPMIQFDKAEVIAKLLDKYPTLKRLGDITSISVADQTDHEGYSRLTKIQLLGSTGKSDVVRAEDLRLTIDPTGRKLRSTICQIMELDGKWAFLSGRGWGHGVGMCQYGAEGMARQGKTTEEILAHYYPGSKIATIEY
ncbi:MAG: SpoIID/LytB domain-containing protein [Sedimentisphaerales bacterium]|nr:SpoIID/LytB domain-containing protein [Sedimentisphaerales bacterium]